MLRVIDPGITGFLCSFYAHIDNPYFGDDVVQVYFAGTDIGPYYLLPYGNAQSFGPVFVDNRWKIQINISVVLPGPGLVTFRPNPLFGDFMSGSGFTLVVGPGDVAVVD